jgi:2-oxoglutarate ferredoxin oxidoreductase subunit alpha
MEGEKKMARVFMKGCEAIAEAAVRAGCRFFAGYPITPQNEIPEYFARRMPEVGGVFVQGESEIASANMVYGAAAAGTRAMTSSSSVGISLKSECISYCAAARVPMVYANISRGGPGVGSIQPAQMDYLQATKASGNGGFEMMVFAPCSVQEAVDMTYNAFAYADRDRNRVLILCDGLIGTLMEPVELPEMKPDGEVAEIKNAKRPWACVGHRLD